MVFKVQNIKEGIIMNFEKKLLFVSDAASMLSCSSSRVYDLLRSGELKGCRVSKRGTWRIPEKELDDYLTRLQNNSTR